MPVILLKLHPLSFSSGCLNLFHANPAAQAINLDEETPREGESRAGNEGFAYY